MAFDPKYGQIDIPGIDEDEVVVVLRSRDQYTPQMLDFYANLCTEGGSPQHHIAGIHSTKAAVEAWQAENPTQVPQSASRAPQPEARADAQNDTQDEEA